MGCCWVKVIKVLILSSDFTNLFLKIEGKEIGACGLRVGGSELEQLKTYVWSPSSLQARTYYLLSKCTTIVLLVKPSYKTNFATYNKPRKILTKNVKAQKLQE